jgi:hypothetical protein
MVVEGEDCLDICLKRAKRNQDSPSRCSELRGPSECNGWMDIHCGCKWQTAVRPVLNGRQCSADKCAPVRACLNQIRPTYDPEVILV